MGRRPTRALNGISQRHYINLHKIRRGSREQISLVAELPGASPTWRSTEAARQWHNDTPKASATVPVTVQLKGEIDGMVTRRGEEHGLRGARMRGSDMLPYYFRPS